MHRLLFSVAFAGLIASALAASNAHAQQLSPPHICFFLVDDLGYGDVGFTGCEDLSTPNIDAIAKEGAVLEQFYVMHVCSPTRAAFMTGRYPIRYGLQTGVIRPNAPFGLSTDERTIADMLKRVGYDTAVVGKWHLGLNDPAFLPTRRGFDRQYGHYCGALDYFTHHRDGALDWHRDDRANRDEGYSTTLIADEAVRIVENADPAKPLFLYVPFNAVHTPLQAPEDRLAKFADLKPPGRAKMAAMLDVVDESIGRVRDAFARRGFDENLIYLFSTDNGGFQPGKVTDNGPFRDGKGSLYEGGVRSCAAMSWKGRIEPGTKVAAPMHIVDLYPTLSRIANQTLDESRPLHEKLPLDGRNVWPCIVDGAPSPHEDILINAEAHRGALRKGDWKLIVFEPTGPNGRRGGRPNGRNANGPNANKGDERTIELYDLASDPGEKKNVADANPDVVGDLVERYDRYRAESVTALNLSDAEPLPTPKIWGQTDRAE